MQIAIDGPAGAGKSTIAKRLAKELGYLYIDTGAMYRALCLAALEKSVPAEEGPDLEALLNEVDIRLSHGQDGQEVYLNQHDVTALIRRLDVSEAVSHYSALPSVREKMTRAQRQIAENENVIMDGRDIGSVVLPNADYKFFLTASVEERAKRRQLQLREQGIATEFSDLVKDIAERDERDRTRAVAPLVEAADAIYINSDNLDKNDVCNKILSILEK